MGRLRRRLDGLEAHAHRTMSGADQLTALAKDLIADLADGIQIEVEIFGHKLPFILRIDPREKIEGENHG